MPSRSKFKWVYTNRLCFEFREFSFRVFEEMRCYLHGKNGNWLPEDSGQLCLDVAAAVDDASDLYSTLPHTVKDDVLTFG